MKPVAHCQFLPREDTFVVANGFVQPIDVNINTVTTSLVVRWRTPIRAKIEVPSLVLTPLAAASSAAPLPACGSAPVPPRRTVVGSPHRGIAAGVHLRFAHGRPLAPHLIRGGSHILSMQMTRSL